MLRKAGTNLYSAKKFISEIYKSNTRLLAKLAEHTKEKEAQECKKEKENFLNTYEVVLCEGVKLALESVYSELENSIIQLIPSLKLNKEFLLSILDGEIGVTETVDIKNIQISTGSFEFFELYEDVFNLNFDEGLDENYLLIRYNDMIKTIDFSNMSDNIIKDVKRCRKKHLSMIDALKTKQYY